MEVKIVIGARSEKKLIQMMTVMQGSGVRGEEGEGMWEMRQRRALKPKGGAVSL